MRPAISELITTDSSERRLPTAVTCSVSGPLVTWAVSTSTDFCAGFSSLAATGLTGSGASFVGLGVSLCIACSTGCQNTGERTKTTSSAPISARRWPSEKPLLPLAFSIEAIPLPSGSRCPFLDRRWKCRTPRQRQCPDRGQMTDRRSLVARREGYWRATMSEPAREAYAPRQRIYHQFGGKETWYAGDYCRVGPGSSPEASGRSELPDRPDWSTLAKESAAWAGPV